MMVTKGKTQEESMTQIYIHRDLNNTIFKRIKLNIKI